MNDSRRAGRPVVFLSHSMFASSMDSESALAVQRAPGPFCCFFLHAEGQLLGQLSPEITIDPGFFFSMAFAVGQTFPKHFPSYFLD